MRPAQADRVLFPGMRQTPGPRGPLRDRPGGDPKARGLPSGDTEPLPLQQLNPPHERPPSSHNREARDEPAPGHGLGVAGPDPPLTGGQTAPRKYRPQELRHYAAVVEYVYQSRLAVRSQIQRRFPAWIGSERTAQYQLARLVELGYLSLASVRSTSPNFPYVYLATGKGIRLVREAWAEHGVDWLVSAPEEAKAQGRAEVTVLHELMLTELELAIRLTVAARPDLQILTTERRYFRAENQLRFSYQTGQSQVQPDAGFVLAVARPGADRALLLCLVEMDNGSMSVAPRGLTLLHDLCPIVYLIGVTQLFLGLEDRTGGAAPWRTSLASAA
jgi:Replication-relaxation